MLTCGVVKVRVAVTDGKTPTRISLVRSGWPDPSEPDRMLLISPPEETPDGRDYLRAKGWRPGAGTWAR